MLQEIEEREAKAVDGRFRPWVRLLQARVAHTAGRDEESERACEAAAGELAVVFGETVFWQVDREGLVGETPAERAIEVWRRALQVDDVFRYVEAACDLYPVFVWQQGGMAVEGEEDRAAEYQATQVEMKPWGLELPDWDWLVGEDDIAEEEPPEGHQEIA